MNFKFILIFSIIHKLVDSITTRPLSRPSLDLCQTRKIHAKLDGHGYQFSWFLTSPPVKPQLKSLDWLGARNYCRSRCMDTVAIETEREWKFLSYHIHSGKSENDEFSPITVESIWTSGRLCDFDGCEKASHVKPVAVNGWFWSANNKKISPTTCISGNQNCFHAWSDFGFYGFPQPDNREFRAEGVDGNEACLAIVNGTSLEGNHGFPKWHDRACYHATSFVCEDSDALIKFMERKHRGINLRN